jgi:hypothetical protein
MGVSYPVTAATHAPGDFLTPKGQGEETASSGALRRIRANGSGAGQRSVVWACNRPLSDSDGARLDAGKLTLAPSSWESEAWGGWCSKGSQVDSSGREDET